MASKINVSQSQIPSRQEFLSLLTAAWPLVLAQLAQNSLSFIDTMMVGQLGEQSLAGIALGGTVFFFVVFVLSGMILAVGPMVSQAIGAKTLGDATAATQQALWLAILLTPIAVVVFQAITPILLWLGQEAEVARLASGYLKAISWGLPPAFGLFALRGFLEGRNDTTPIMLICFIGIGLNIFANNALMFGQFGLPALGLIGTGYASAIVFWAMFVMLVASIQWRHADFEIFSRFPKPDGAVLREIFRIGAPIGLTIGCEIGLFTITALFMGRFGESELAAHQIAMQTCSVTFMVPLGIGIAASVRVGNAIGEQNVAQAARSAYAGMATGIAFMCLTGIVFIGFPEHIIRLYIDPTASENQAVSQLAISFLGIAGLFQIFDGLQVAASFALRGIKDTTAAMIISAISYLGIGVVSSLLLCYTAKLGPAGLWYGLVVALAAASVLLTWRFRQVIARM